jgi:hypothetical protein
MSLQMSTYSGRAMIADSEILPRGEWSGAKLLGLNELPSDLRSWVPSDRLVSVITGVLDGLNWRNPTLVAYVARHPDYHPWEMLAVLVLAGLTEPLGSQAIVDACKTKPEFRSLCRGWFPFADELTHFRQKNRNLVAIVLVRVLARLFHNRQCRPAPISSPAARNLRNSASERLDILRHLDAAE